MKKAIAIISLVFSASVCAQELVAEISCATCRHLPMLESVGRNFLYEMYCPNGQEACSDIEYDEIVTIRVNNTDFVFIFRQVPQIGGEDFGRFLYVSRSVVE